MEKGHRLDHTSYTCTLICDCSNKPAFGKSKTAFEQGLYVFDMLKKKSDIPANTAWYQEAAFIFASTTGHKIPSLWRHKGDV